MACDSRGPRQRDHGRQGRMQNPAAVRSFQAFAVMQRSFVFFTLRWEATEVSVDCMLGGEAEGAEMTT